MQNPADQRKQPNTINGLASIRFVSVIFINQCHAVVAIAMATGRDFSEQNLGPFARLISTPPFGGFAAWILPSMAGLFIRQRLGANMSFGKLRGYPLTAGFNTFFLLAALESIKHALFFGGAYFFSWGALHLAGISFLFLTWLARFGTKTLLALSAILLAITPVMQNWLMPLLVLSRSEIYSTFHRPVAQISLAVFTGIISTFLAYLFYLAKLVPIVKASFLALLFSISMAIFCMILTWHPREPLLAMIMHNLPVGALVGDPSHDDFHIWPILPWFPTTLIGFCLFDFYSRSRNQKIFKLVLAVVAIVLITQLVPYAPPEYIRSYDLHTIWDSIFFRPPLSVIGIAIGIFLAIFVFWDSVEPLLPRRLLSIMSTISLSILWIYLFQTSIGFALAKPYAMLFGYSTAICTYPYVLLIPSYFLGLFIKRLSKTKIEIRLSR